MIEGFASQILTDAPTFTAIIEASLKRTADVICPFPTLTVMVDAQALKRREKRLLDAYEAGEIELDELRRRQEAIRKTIAAADRAASIATRTQEPDSEEFARLVVRGAYRLKRINDRKEKKAIIHSLFEMLVVKDDSIVSFNLRPELGTTSTDGNGLIRLLTPFRLISLQEELPVGTKRCIHCQGILSVESFRVSSNRHRSCVSRQAHEAYVRRKKVT